jgi:hypothetical protein
LRLGRRRFIFWQILTELLESLVAQARTDIDTLLLNVICKAIVTIKVRSFSLFSCLLSLYLCKTGIFVSLQFRRCVLTFSAPAQRSSGPCLGALQQHAAHAKQLGLA